MNEFRNFIETFQIETPIVYFLMFFALAIGLFHSVILSGLYNWDFRPKWLFYVLNPSLVGLTYLFFGSYVIVTFLFLFGSIFLLAIIGMFVGGLRKSKDDLHFNRVNNIPKKPLWKRILHTALGIIFGLFFFSIGPYAFVLIFVIIILSAILPNKTNRYLKYQGILPSSKIRSVAMGLAEVKGKLISIKEMMAPIENVSCIGYEYKIESISRDKDGKESYSTISSEIVCNRFYIEDETGKIEVNPEQLDFVWIELNKRYESGGRRYSQYIIKANDEMLLIGKVGLEANTPVFMYENIKNVFGIAPASKVWSYNRHKPLLNSFIYFAVIFAFFAAIILITPITIENGTVTLRFDTDLFDWSQFFANFNNLF